MSRYVDLPARGHLPPVSLLVRISNPLNRSGTTIIPNYPTILFCQPIWTDSFFFYPQFDEPALFEKYNLVCIDYRGHGDTILNPLTGPFTWEDVADDAYLALRELGLRNAHVFGTSLGGQIGLHMARQYPRFVSSVMLVNLAGVQEPESWTTAFEECAQLLIKAVKDDDMDALDDVTVGGWGMGVGQVTGAIKELRQRYIDHQRTRLLDGRMKTALPYIKGLLESRSWAISDYDLVNIKCPVLMTNNGASETEEIACRGLIECINGIGNHDDNASTAQAVLLRFDEGPHWLTLTSPHTIHPILLDHLAASATPTVNSLPPSPVSATFSRSSRTSFSSLSSHRRPSTPREMKGFDIPPPPKLGPGILTLGQVLDREKAEGVPMTVEVRVTVQET